MGKRLNLPDSIISEYIDDGKTLDTIALEYNCCLTSIWKFLKAHGVQCRSRGDHLLGVPRSPETKKKLSDLFTGKPKSKEQQERLRNHGFKGHHHSDASKLRISMALRGREFSDEHRTKIANGVRGDRHGNWRGGITSHKYCEKFNSELKESIRNAYNRTCQLCGSKEGEKLLDVHHINFDKNAGCFGRRWNLIPLCRHCHARTTNHRFDSFNLLTCHWAMNPDINLGVNYGIYPYCVERTFDGKRRKGHRFK